MFTNLAGIFQYYHNQIAYMAGQQVNIYRPPGGYTTDQTPTLIQSNIRVKFEVAGIRYASPRVTNIEYYAIFGDRYQFQPGDILITQESESTTPPVTVLNYSPLEECIGIRTAYVGDLIFSLQNGTEVALYKNIRYQWLNPGQAMNNLQNLLNGSQDHQDRRVCFYTLPGLQPSGAVDNSGNIYDIPGLRLIEQGTVPVRWMVKLVIQNDGVTQLVLEQEDGA